jgi:multidrug transporter EmrE-like cation transporter
MTVPAPALLLASAFLHAVWNALLKREDQPQVAVAGVLSVALGMAAIAAFFSPGHAFPNAASFSWALGAGIFEGLYFVTLAAALARVDYGIAYAIARGGAMVVVWPVSVAFLAEPLRPTGALGVAVMGIGLAFANLAGGQTTSRAITSAMSARSRRKRPRAPSLPCRSRRRCRS